MKDHACCAPQLDIVGHPDDRIPPSPSGGVHDIRQALMRIATDPCHTFAENVNWGASFSSDHFADEDTVRRLQTSQGSVRRGWFALRDASHVDPLCLSTRAAATIAAVQSGFAHTLIIDAPLAEAILDKM